MENYEMSLCDLFSIIFKDIKNMVKELYLQSY